jgi:hypothetical protein
MTSLTLQYWERTTTAAQRQTVPRYAALSSVSKKKLLPYSVLSFWTSDQLTVPLDGSCRSVAVNKQKRINASVSTLVSHSDDNVHKTVSSELFKSMAQIISKTVTSQYLS